MNTPSRPRSALLVASILATTACASPVVSRMALPSPSSSARGSSSPSPALILDTQLGVASCSSAGTSGSADTRGLRGFARIQLRDGELPGTGSELEYELWIENGERLPLSAGAIVLSGVAEGDGGGETIEAVLWSGDTYDKQRLRMRGILTLPRGTTTSQVAKALRDRRGALSVHIAQRSGADAACGDLRD